VRKRRGGSAGGKTANHGAFHTHLDLQISRALPHTNTHLLWPGSTRQRKASRKRAQRGAVLGVHPPAARTGDAHPAQRCCNAILHTPPRLLQRNHARMDFTRHCVVFATQHVMINTLGVGRTRIKLISIRSCRQQTRNWLPRTCRCKLRTRSLPRSFNARLV